jgi:hypothetical protein
VKKRYLPEKTDLFSTHEPLARDLMKRKVSLEESAKEYAAQ